MPVSIDLEIKADYYFVPNINSLMSILWVDSNYYMKQGVAFSSKFYDHKIGTKMKYVSICVPVCIN